MLIGTILARFLENATGQNRVPATIFSSRFWKCFQTHLAQRKSPLLVKFPKLYIVPLLNKTQKIIIGLLIQVAERLFLSCVFYFNNY